MGIKYLQCDAEGCGHIESIDSLTREMIGKPCPLCGADMLTEDDYQAGLKIEGMMDLMVSLGLATSEENATKDHVKVEINPRGGELNLKIKKVE